MANDKIVVRFIIEVMGRPKEVVQKTLEKVCSFIEERHKIVSKEISDVSIVENSNLLSAFLEVEFEVRNFEELFLAILDFGPTVVEIIEPSKIVIDAGELQAVISDLITKLHNMSNKIQTLHTENIKLKRLLSSKSDNK